MGPLPLSDAGGLQVSSCGVSKRSSKTGQKYVYKCTQAWYVPRAQLQYVLTQSRSPSVDARHVLLSCTVVQSAAPAVGSEYRVHAHSYPPTPEYSPRTVQPDSEVRECPGPLAGPMGYVWAETVTA